MKIVAVVLLLAPAWAQAPLKTAAVVNPPTERPNGMRQVVTSFENHLNDKITEINGADPVYIVQDSGNRLGSPLGRHQGRADQGRPYQLSPFIGGRQSRISFGF